MNRLADQSSPYLRQHADNPVDWYPWGPEATAEARRSDRPILLSVGYSACHWCHVMAHESFEDPDVAEVMNRLFVNVKVDREERPDVDALYMDAVQAISGHGGWPMTVFLTPDGEPFFAGTYFPPEPRHGMPGFPQLLEAIGQAWVDQRDELTSQAGQVTELLRRVSARSASPSLPDHRLLAQASGALLSRHDPVHGGFGPAPKFPNPLNFDLLLRHHAATGDAEALQAVTTTLDHMASGGIFDHLGGGFARYSTDSRWLVPHFEKMLYDNALLATAYLHGWQVTGNDDYAQVVTETIGYVLADLRLPDGGFASAEDADSEGEEGKFYVWTSAELEEVLSGSELVAARAWYGVSDQGNFEGKANILHRPEIGQLARPELVERAREALHRARTQRVRPGLDDKVLTEWNGLMISALAEAGAAMGRPDWIAAGVGAMEFLLANLRDGTGRWYRNWQDEGTARHLAYAEDYASLVDALSRLGEATGQARWHQLAVGVADAMLDRFWDGEGGGLFTTGRDAAELLIRRKELHDGVTASANANAAFGLLRLAALGGRPDLGERARDILRLVSGEMAAQPQAHGRLLAAFDLASAGATEIVVSGDRPDLVREVWRRYLPNAVLAWGEPFDSPLWEGRAPGAAYVCRNYTCDLPAKTAADLANQLDRRH